jgi:Domain of unknown function (DUF4157)
MRQQHLSPTQKTIVSSQSHTQAIAQHSTHPIEQLQGAIGNRAVNQLLANQPIVQAKPMFRGLSHELVVQPKLTIGDVGDKYEQEADRVATNVVSQMNAPENSAIQRQEMSEEENEEKLRLKPVVQRLSDGNETAAPPDLEASIQQVKGSGQPLPITIRQPMEQALGANFKNVKIHTDPQADQLNQSIQAKAFTTGQDILFRHGEYNPGSRVGQELIAHELTHVVQQTHNNSSGESIVQMAPAPAQIGNPNGAKLHKSNRKKVNRGEARKISVRSGGIFDTGIKSTIPFNANITVDFAKTAQRGTYVWVRYNQEEGYINVAHIAASNTRWRNHQQANIVAETTGFLNAIGADNGVGGFNLPQGNLTVANVPALNNFNVAPVTSMTAPANLTQQQRRFLAGRFTGLNDRQVYERGFIVRYQNYPERFHRMMRQGKVLWTLDVDNILSIGSPANNKHAVVAGGKDVWAAGEASLKSAVDYYKERGDITDKHLNLWGDIAGKDLEIATWIQLGQNNDAQRVTQEKNELIQEIGGQTVFDWITQIQEEIAPGDLTVVLDFGSGHYAPRGAWKKATDAWKAAGFKVEWDSRSQWV